MILFDLNYLEPVSEKNSIVGGLLNSTSTDSTGALTLASTTAGGELKVGGFALALSGANGENTSATTQTDTLTIDNGPLTLARAHAGADAVSSGDNYFANSNSHSTSQTTTNPNGSLTVESGVGFSFSS